MITNHKWLYEHRKKFVIHWGSVKCSTLLDWNCSPFTTKPYVLRLTNSAGSWSCKGKFTSPTARWNFSWQTNGHSETRDCKVSSPTFCRRTKKILPSFTRISISTTISSECRNKIEENENDDKIGRCTIILIRILFAGTVWSVRKFICSMRTWRICPPRNDTETCESTFQITCHINSVQ